MAAQFELALQPRSDGRAQIRKTRELEAEVSARPCEMALGRTAARQCHAGTDHADVRQGEPAVLVAAKPPCELDAWSEESVDSRRSNMQFIGVAAELDAGRAKSGRGDRGVQLQFAGKLGQLCEVGKLLKRCSLQRHESGRPGRRNASARAEIERAAGKARRVDIEGAAAFVESASKRPVEILAQLRGQWLIGPSQSGDPALGPPLPMALAIYRGEAELERSIELLQRHVCGMDGAAVDIDFRGRLAQRATKGGFNVEGTAGGPS